MTRCLDEAKLQGYFDGELPIDQVEFVPCRPALDIKVGAEPQGMHRLAHDVLDRLQAAEIDDRNHLSGEVRKNCGPRWTEPLAAP